ncbi:fluoride efflux transporter CrcB [Staphylococcus caprae]|uniref:fluoride efflux transporter CrcB n=1 Tax=Staphylococcus caprae TaxID=29380 RepID=UPI000E694F34|nr:fluoride efflux transporter CrcB [Staphylococcus caprae]MBU5270633.1 fluoride efflux transporter CrcB [Staphylococcus caprae]MDK6297727.1 fluoride efflux transporter CrcB [Staphylococcus caprae]MDK7232009.1 fluoride efflux transporter CrcB [Staphylococcus caprae]RIM33641.1 fluoride efflux transporter CrcB [Staphylococcus caprae]
MQYLYVFIGGAFGALLRYGLSIFNEGSSLPIGTLIANLTGAFLMGLIGTLAISLFQRYPLVKKAITTGFLGALTTFSTFQFELVQLFDQQRFIMLFTYGLTSYILGIVLCYLGVKVGGRLS